MRLLRSHIDSGISSVMLPFMIASPVTEPLVHVISGHVQWSDDGVQWLREGGLDHCCLSPRRMFFSWSGWLFCEIQL